MDLNGDRARGMLFFVDVDVLFVVVVGWRYCGGAEAGVYVRVMKWDLTVGRAGSFQ